MIRFRCDRNMDGRVTEKDMKQVFLCHTVMKSTFLASLHAHERLFSITRAMRDL